MSKSIFPDIELVFPDIENLPDLTVTETPSSKNPKSVIADVNACAEDTILIGNFKSGTFCKFSSLKSINDNSNSLLFFPLLTICNLLLSSSTFKIKFALSSQLFKTLLKWSKLSEI